MAKATPKKFAMQRVFEILLRKPYDKSILGYLSDCKTSSLENTVEMVYPTGGAGNVYIGTGFAHSRHATLNVEVATFNTEVMALQNGTEIETKSHKITYYDVIEVGSGDIKTTHKAVGTAGEEISFVYILNSDGTYGETFEQAGSVAEGKFAYNPATRVITFNEGEGPVAGDRIACAYTWETADTAQKITLDVSGVPATVLVSAYGLARDICTGELFPCVLEGQAQIDGNWNWDLSADGDPVVQSFNMEFVKPCLGDKLYDFYIYTDEEE